MNWIIMIIVIVLHFWECFTKKFADGLLLKFMWLQVSSSLPDSS